MQINDRIYAYVNDWVINWHRQWWLPSVLEAPNRHLEMMVALRAAGTQMMEVMQEGLG